MSIRWPHALRVVSHPGRISAMPHTGSTRAWDAAGSRLKELERQPSATTISETCCEITDTGKLQPSLSLLGVLQVQVPEPTANHHQVIL
jgi:hypothetical protein